MGVDLVHARATKISMAAIELKLGLREESGEKVYAGLESLRDVPVENPFDGSRTLDDEIESDVSDVLTSILSEFEGVQTPGDVGDREDAEELVEELGGLVELVKRARRSVPF